MCRLLIATVLCTIVASTSASKFVSVAVKRDTIPDNEFAFSFDRDAANVSIVKGIVFQTVSAPRHRLMGMKDVDVAFVRVLHKPDAVVPWHVHPRGSENFATIHGTIEVSTMLEGATTPRRVVAKLPPAHVTSVPQGLPHTVKCISKNECIYHIFFNSADAGFIPTPTQQ